MNIARQTSAHYGLRLTFKGRVWIAAICLSLSAWGMIIWLVMQIFA